MEALSEALERSGATVEDLTKDYKRIVELDVDGVYVSRASRTLARMAQVRLPFGTRLEEAASLYRAIGDEEGLETTQRRLAEYRKRTRYAQFASISAFVLLGLSFVSFDSLFSISSLVSSWIRAALATLFPALVWAGVASEEEASKWRVAALAGIPIASGMAVFYFSESLLLASGAAFFVGSVVHGALVGEREMPPELRRKRPEVRGALAQLLVKAGTFLLTLAERARTRNE